MTRLTLLIPCYNEAGRLPRTLSSFLARLPDDPAATEVIVLDDGSEDGTAELTRSAAAGDPRVRLLRWETNVGKGFAIRAGMLAASGDVIVFTDADGSYGPEQAERVASALDAADVAIGARGAPQPGGPLARGLASRAFNLAVRRLLGLEFNDTQCGLKGFRRAAAADIFGRARVDGFAFDAEALFLAGRLGLTVAEVPVTPERREGSKVRLAGDALQMLRQMWQVRRAAAAGAYGLPAGQTLAARAEAPPPA
jgi:dolichyl-phosphate beta-glucosyltransferase